MKASLMGKGQSAFELRISVRSFEVVTSLRRNLGIRRGSQIDTPKLHPRELDLPNLAMGRDVSHSCGPLLATGGRWGQ